jgi:hypothetical protein
MRRLNVPPQVARLLLLTVAIVWSYLVARHFLTPASFGELGWYRADALTEAASYDRVYAGAAACSECHDQGETLATGAHASLSCEGCHGPGQGHSESFDQHPMVVLTFSHCVRCHEANPSRPAWHTQIATTDHYPGSPCIECHLPHNPNEAPE